MQTDKKKYIDEIASENQAALEAEMEHWHIEEATWKVEQISHMLQMHRIQPETVCEVGSGSGDILQMLQQKMNPQCVFYGYDTSPIAIAYSKEKENERLHFKQVDIRYEEGVPQYDVMLVMDVLEHIKDHLGFLRGLRPKSDYKIFQVSLNLSVQTVLRKNGLLNIRNIYGMTNFFTKETLLQVLRDADYEIIDCFYTTPGLDLPTHVLKKKLMKIPRRLLYNLNPDLAVRLLGSFRLLVLAK